MTGSFPSNFQGEVWVPDDKTTFRKGQIIDYIEDGKKCKVQLDGSSDVNVYDCDKVEKCNPPVLSAPPVASVLLGIFILKVRDFFSLFDKLLLSGMLDFP